TRPFRKPTSAATATTTSATQSTLVTRPGYSRRKSALARLNFLRFPKPQPQ
ncbi:MAG: hypothetical protein QOG29_1893, partial [Gaiellaceae bacterium]|nr:hypothetical protein [Gaiellaceae bacterium]